MLKLAQLYLKVKPNRGRKRIHSVSRFDDKFLSLEYIYIPSILIHYIPVAEQMLEVFTWTFKYFKNCS